ncbi:MAG: DUF6712 family protein [Bacteroidales bacterium]|nr:DUF6712 family protein [Bacteroidales bacterium]
MLFKAENNAKADEIRQYISVNSSISFDSLLPHIESAESKYIKKILGREQYLELCAYYSDPLAWPPIERIPKTHEDWLAKLLKLVQKSLINLALLDGFAILSVNIGDSGAFRKETDSQKPLFQYQEENLKNTFRTEGFNTLDAILEFLEENINNFPIFKESDTYTVFKSKFIPTATVFNEYYNIGGSRLVFLHLQKYIDLVNDFSIIPVIGRSFFDELIVAMTSGVDLTDKQKSVIRFIQKIQAFLSVSKGIATLGMNITHNGTYFISDGTNSSNFRKKDPASIENLRLDIKNTQQTGQAYIDYLKDYLHDNIEDFPTYAEFNAYNQGEPTDHRDNTDKKTFWA